MRSTKTKALALTAAVTTSLVLGACSSSTDEAVQAGGSPTGETQPKQDSKYAPQASWNVPETLDLFVGGAETIVSATVKEVDLSGFTFPSVSEEYPPSEGKDPAPETNELAKYSVTVDEVLKGDPALVGTNVTVYKLRWIESSFPSESDLNSPASNTSDLSEGSNVVLGLSSLPAAATEKGVEGFMIVGSDLGVFDIEGDSIVARSELSPLKEPIPLETLRAAAGSVPAS